MQIFYTDISEYIKNAQSRTEKKNLQHKYGELLTRKIAKEFYNIKNPEIQIKNKKPYFANSKINFSISHCENIVITAFDSNPIGIDIQKIQPRNFEKLAKRYNLKNHKPDTFYEFWTKYEAEIKLQQKAKTIITTKLPDEFILTVAGDFDSDYKITEIKIFLN